MRWALILAGGNGSRMQPLTRALTGDDRPKQFCPLLGDKTLLAQTRARVALNVDPSRTVFVVTRAHEPYYVRELSDVPPSQVVEQPANRGTAAAIAYGIARIASRDRDAVVAMFPADHYYEDTLTLQRTIDHAYRVASERRDRVLLLGSEPSCPEVEYGWIEPGRLTPGDKQIAKVRRFWEKPSLAVAETLLERGCLWNMFILIGTVAAFRSLLYASVPGMTSAFELAEQYPQITVSVDEIYRTLEPVDFSRDVLAPHAHKVGVVRVPHIGWTDLGQPARVRGVLANRVAARSAEGLAS